MHSVVRDAEQTKRRLLEAAIAEFSAFGIAGARVDRIATQAGANKSLIYSYFGSKEKLFEAVAAALVLDTQSEAPIRPDDLPGYAVALFDSYLRRPEALRLSLWFRLEAPAGTPEPPALRQANAAKVAAIRRAQAAGAVRTDLEAAELLGVIISLSLLGAYSAPGLDVAGQPAAVRRRQRAAVRAAVAAVIKPPDSAP
jgi:AcrR family transcriptional regulator